MGSAERVSIDPPEVRRGAGQLRLCGDNADEISSDTTRALLRADVISQVPSSLADVDEELNLLADILVRRAGMIDSYQLTLLTDPAAQIDALWTSLIDDDGATALITGDNALELIQRHLTDIDDDGSGTLTQSELEAVANGHDPVLAAAANALLSNENVMVDLERRTTIESGFQERQPTFSATALADLLETNEKLRGDSALAAAALAVGDTSIDIDGATVDAEDIVVSAINNGVFTHDAGAAQDFLALLPNTANGVPGLSIFDVGTTAVEALYDAAMTDVAADDLLTRFDVVSQMPETTDGIRNYHITQLYALGAVALDAAVNPDAAGDPSLPGHKGMTWLGWGAGASDSAGEGITGEAKAFEFIPPTQATSQLIADGNQLIATTILGHYFTFLDTFGDGDVTEEKVITFFEGFDEGEGDLQIAFARQLAAMETDDPQLAQVLQLESNFVVTAYEQAVVDDTLDFNKLEVTAKAGTHVLTTLISIAKGDIPSSKSVSEVFTEQGTLDIPKADGTVIEFELDEPVPPGPQENNLVTDVDPAGASNPADMELHDVELPGLEHVDPVSRVDEQTGLSLDPNDWDQSTVYAEDWTTYGDRMNQIFDLLQKHHVNPDAFDVAELIIDG